MQESFITWPGGSPSFQMFNHRSEYFPSPENVGNDILAAESLHCLRRGDLLAVLCPELLSILFRQGIDQTRRKQGIRMSTGVGPSSGVSLHSLVFSLSYYVSAVCT